MGRADGPAPARVACVNLGCRVNRVELDDIASELEAAGCVICDEASADLVVVNTCAVTGEAEAKARKAVRHAAALPRMPWVVATGCVASLFEDEVASLGERVVVQRDKARVAGEALRLLGLAACEGDVGTCGHAGTPTGRTRPGVKVQDGCDNRCTYCIVWKARGRARSLDLDEAVARVAERVASGAREVVLTGINLGRYESTSGGRTVRLPELLDGLLRRTDVGRLRLSSVEPQDVDADLLRVMADSDGRVAPFLHVPLQSGCDATLAAMNRTYDTAYYARMVDAARRALPDLSLGCDLIVGFPGETDAQFEDSLSFCERMGFSKMHVFRYSRRPGTPAAQMDCQVEPKVSAERARRMRCLAARMRREAAMARVGHEELVVVQEPGRGVTGGLFDAIVDTGCPGELVRARVSSCDEELLDARPSAGSPSEPGIHAGAILGV